MEIQKLAEKYKIRPKKSLGQNFITNTSVIDKSIEAANLKPEDIVLEIGPGLGTLTLELAKKAKQVIAIEKDEKIASILRGILKENDIDNVKVIEGDILKTQPEIEEIKNNEYKVIANIPYYITQPIIRLFLESDNTPREIILLVQKEVAERICANPPKSNLLATSIQFYAKPEIISLVSKNDFWPVPKVDSAVLRISPNQTSAEASDGSGQAQIKTELTKKEVTQFFKVMKAGFSMPRKMLAGNLAKKLEIPKEKILESLKNISIDEKVRAGNLSIKKWMELSDLLTK